MKTILSFEGEEHELTALLSSLSTLIEAAPTYERTQLWFKNLRASESALIQRIYQLDKELSK